jgi:hypothetical protein
VPPIVTRSHAPTGALAYRPRRNLDDVHSELWAAIHHLFPSHATALPTETGGLSISWSMEGDPHARYNRAAPILIRLEDDLIGAMCLGTREQQRSIARKQEGAVRAGLTGYDPYAPLPKARVIVLG